MRFSKWGPWVDHDGISGPVKLVGFVAEFEEQDACGMIFYSGPALIDVDIIRRGSWDWAMFPEYTKVLRYRLQRPRAFRELVRLSEDIPQIEQVTA